MLDESVIIQLVEMGFPMDACRKLSTTLATAGPGAAARLGHVAHGRPGRQGWEGLEQEPG